MCTINSVLFHCLLFFSCAIYPLASETPQSASILVGEPFLLNDYEVLSVHENDEEDILYLKKRADEEDCGNDCLDYSGWQEDGVMHCESEDLINERSLDIRAILEKRGRKPTMTICRGVSPNGGFTLDSPAWPESPDTLINIFYKYQAVYDTGDPREPLDKEWFELKKRTAKWTDDLIGRKATRCYAAEHVLEWQLLRDFIESDKRQGTNSICAYLEKWFLEDMVQKSYKVKVAKDQGQLQSDNHNEYEDKEYDLGVWSVPKKPAPRYLEWISFQWPGTAGGSPRNLWEYELVVLNGDTNGKKENVWAGKNIFPAPELEPDGRTMRKTQNNGETLEWLFENKYWEKGLKTRVDNKGKCAAIYRFMTVMSIAQYHNDPYVQEVMRAQVRRVGEAWELIEKEIQTHPNTKAKGTYQARGLKKEWISWMEDTHKKRLSELNKAMDDGIKVFEGQSSIITKLKRWDYSGILGRAVKQPNCGSETSSQVMDDRVKLLIKAYKSMKKVQEDLKLD